MLFRWHWRTPCLVLHSLAECGRTWCTQDPSLQDLLSHQDPDISNTAKEATQHMSHQRTQEPIKTLLKSLVEERDGLPNKDSRLSALDASIMPLTHLVGA